MDGDVVTDIGVYLICDNGYLHWPTSICPFMHADKTMMEGYFSTNIESIRKDVECIFMLDMMESRSNRYRVGRGIAVSNLGVWLGDGEDTVQFSLEVDNKINE